MDKNDLGWDSIIESWGGKKKKNNYPHIDGSIIDRYNLEVDNYRDAQKNMQSEINNLEVNGRSNAKKNAYKRLFILSCIFAVIEIIYLNEDQYLILIIIATFIAAPLWFLDGLSDSIFEKHFSDEIREKRAKLENKLNYIKKRMDNINSEIVNIQQKQLSYWQSLDGWQFENEVAKVFEKNGYETQVTKGSGDGGIDLILHKDNQITVVQCKSHKKEVGPHVARDLYGALIHERADNAILVSTTGFTNGVYSFVNDKPIRLMTIQDIIGLNEKQ